MEHFLNYVPFKSSNLSKLETVAVQNNGIYRAGWAIEIWRDGERNCSCLIWLSGFLVRRLLSDVFINLGRKLCCCYCCSIGVYFRFKKTMWWQWQLTTTTERKTFHFIIFRQINFHCMSRRIVDFKWMRRRCGEMATGCVVFACGTHSIIQYAT